MYPNTRLYIDGEWRDGSAGRTVEVSNPASGAPLGHVAVAERADLDLALAAAGRAEPLWRRVSAYERSAVLRRAATLLRERAEPIARILTMEQGKPLREAKLEIAGSADIIDWMAEEGRRTYGRLIPARSGGVTQLVVKEPVGPVAAFAPWNFPVSQAVRKIAAALAAGCPIIVKPPEETPASPAELVRAFHDAGVPPGVINVVYGVPSDISAYLVPHPVIRKVSFTGSVPVGKHLAALAGQHMKRATMELGGHAPVIVFDDADIPSAAKLLAAAKYRNAGQVCVSPTRFLVQSDVHDEFVERFVAEARAIRVGDGVDEASGMGPLVNERRRSAVEELIEDAVERGARLECGGNRVGNKGWFLEPTVVTGVAPDMRAMNEEPFGPVALVGRFDAIEEATAEANRLPFGLASYAFTRSLDRATQVSSDVQSGMMTINHIGLALPETPFGGVKDSGYGSEGGTEALEAYLVPKFITQARL